MSNALADPKLRLDRADEHFGDLDREITAYLRGKPYSVVSQREADGDFVVRAYILKEPPDRIKVLIGDVCHSLRTALDQLAHVLASPAGGGDPPAGTEFAIFADSVDYMALDKKTGKPRRGSGLYKVRGIPPAAQAVIESLQPYHRVHDPKGHDLWMVHELDIIDKHRKGLTTGAITDDAAIAIKSLHDVNNYRVAHVGGAIQAGPFQSGAEVARLSFQATGPNPQVNMDIYTSFKVAFNPTGPGRGELVLDCLTRLREYVRNVVLPQLEVFV